MFSLLNLGSVLKFCSCFLRFCGISKYSDPPSLVMDIRDESAT